MDEKKSKNLCYMTKEMCLMPKKYFQIGSQINCISTFESNDIYVFFGTYDGFIHCIKCFNLSFIFINER